MGSIDGPRTIDVDVCRPSTGDGSSGFRASSLAAASRGAPNSGTPAGRPPGARRGSPSGCFAIHSSSSASVGGDEAATSSDQELELLAQPPPDDRVVAVEAHAHRLAGGDLLLHVVVDQPLQLGLRGRPLPGACEARGEVLHEPRGDGDPARSGGPSHLLATRSREIGGRPAGGTGRGARG